MNSIFTRLLAARANSKEDYLTECFAGLLDIWSKEDSNDFKCFIEWLTGKRIEGELKEIATQKTAASFGRPDLWIQFENHLILIENKWDAPVGDGQIEAYFDYLKQTRKKTGKETSLILLSRWHNEYPWGQKKPDKEVTWIEISRKVKNKLEEPEGGHTPLLFYKKQFYNFLEDNNMADKPVSWQYMEGASALLRLVELIKNSLEELESEGKVSESQITHGQKWAGCYFFSPDGQNKFWFGQLFDGNYERLIFTVEELKSWCLPREGSEWSGKTSRIFSFSTCFFFSLDTDGQKNAVKIFIRETLNMFSPDESQE